MWITRNSSESLKKLSLERPAVFLGGVRQCGKSSLFRHLFPKHTYVTLDHVDQALAASENPREFLEQRKGPLIIDEIQYAPQLFRELKVLIDENRHTYGQYLLTGSQRFELMKGIQESLAGRLGVFHLETLGIAELRAANLLRDGENDIFLRGGYPQLWSEPHLRTANFFEDYLQTYLHRDLQAIISVEKIRDYRRFLSILATRVGQICNASNIAKDVGVSSVTIKNWLSAMLTAGLIYLVPPYFANLGKRLIKSPKLYFADLGLLSHLLRIRDVDAVMESPFWGSIWENFVFCELIKSCLVSANDIFFYRDQNAVEIDFLVQSDDTLHFIEAKASERPDASKLNFAKVIPLFGDSVKTKAWLACTSPSDEIASRKDYRVVNPLRCLWTLQ